MNKDSLWDMFMVREIIPYLWDICIKTDYLWQLV